MFSPSNSLHPILKLYSEFFLCIVPLKVFHWCNFHSSLNFTRHQPSLILSLPSPSPSLCIPPHSHLFSIPSLLHASSPQTPGQIPDMTVPLKYTLHTSTIIPTSPHTNRSRRRVLLYLTHQHATHPAPHTQTPKPHKHPTRPHTNANETEGPLLIPVGARRRIVGSRRSTPLPKNPTPRKLMILQLPVLGGIK